MNATKMHEAIEDAKKEMEQLKKLYAELRAYTAPFEQATHTTSERIKALERFIYEADRIAFRGHNLGTAQPQ